LSTLALQQRHQPLGLARPPAKDQDRHVFALETYCPATDGFSAARIEKEVVVTDTGSKAITHFPAEDLPIANAY
jgi:Xaa-Pro aminopeptidase